MLRLPPASSNVTKGFLVVTVVFSLVAQLTKKTQMFNLDLTLLGQGQVGNDDEDTDEAGGRH